MTFVSNSWSFLFDLGRPTTLLSPKNNPGTHQYAVTRVAQIIPASTQNMNDGIKTGGNGNFEGGHHLWAKLGAKAGSKAGSNGNFKVGHAAECNARKRSWEAKLEATVTSRSGMQLGAMAKLEATVTSKSGMQLRATAGSKAGSTGNLKVGHAAGGNGWKQSWKQSWKQR